MTENDIPAGDSTEEFERLAESSETYVLQLYVSGMTSHSTEAINNLMRICEIHLKGRYTLEIIDIFKNPELAGSGQIVATPTLIKHLPLPLRSLVGTLSNEERVLKGLNLTKRT